MHPLDGDPAQSYFVLAEERPCCVGCLPRDPARAVEVFARAPVPVTGRPVRLTGVLRRIADATGFLWQVRDATASDAPSRAAGFPRRALLAGGPLLCLAATTPLRPAAAATPIGETEGRAAIAGAVTVDLHSHSGGLAGLRRIMDEVAFQDVAGPMRAGNMAVACLSVVSDAPAHKIGADGRIHPFRDPEPGELAAYAERCFSRLHRLIAEQKLGLVLTASDLQAARGENPSAIVAAEGADFLEGRIDAIDEAYERHHLRHLQLTHYRVNEFGDIQTEAAVHGGLTDLGAEAIRRCNARGIVVDIAHGTYDLVKRAASITTKPLILSHTSLSRAPKPFSRMISAEHARLVAETGGVIGIWPPASIYPTLDRMALGIARMVEVVGVDHVGLGSDAMGLVGPAVFRDYDDTPALSAALLRRGFAPAEVRKILGENYLRVFTQTLAT